ncbi:DUF6884 domain-containing protein [Streptomyces sp. B21-108]|uniref:DUF6884 domain-containing protein n=1 Tax=Streptomyces sp. B21-108 TaxID=3039419 RepID=UPI003FA6E5F0
MYLRACRTAAEALRPDRLLILSARYGLLDLDDVVEPYDTPHGAKESASPQPGEPFRGVTPPQPARRVVAVGAR